MNAAMRNAQRLLADAKLLLEAERYPTAASLATLSIEEGGKVSLLRGMVADPKEGALRGHWRDFRDHRSKNGMWIFPELVANGARVLGDFAVVVDRDAEHTALLNSLKQIGFYCDCYGENAHWAEPAKIIGKDLAKALVGFAEILCPKEEVTVREVELWVQEIGSVYGGPGMYAALLRWAEAMYREGLSKRNPQEYAQFLLGDEGGETAGDRAG